MVMTVMSNEIKISVCPLSGWYAWEGCWGELKINCNNGYHPYQAGKNMGTLEVNYQGISMT